MKRLFFYRAQWAPRDREIWHHVRWEAGLAWNPLQMLLTERAAWWTFRSHIHR